MKINNAQKEDLDLLKLLVSKLEECIQQYGVDFLINKSHESHISNLFSYDEAGYDTASLCAPNPIKRVEIRFSNKKYWGYHWFSDGKMLDDNDGQYQSPYLNICWDHFSSLFEIDMGIHEFTVDTTNPKKIRHVNTVGKQIAYNFGFNYRREIMGIKIRLGKMYAKLKHDKAAMEDQKNRKEFTDIANKTFPDLFDLLILGGITNEKRDD